jgi:ER-bound oxygenase mpaB/B'/Rubber oxygenase, catalytic domain
VILGAAWNRSGDEPTQRLETLAEGFAAARSLHRRHSQITGVLPQTAGLFKAGSRYQANNISALRWVFTTLTDSAVAAHELIFGPLSALITPREGGALGSPISLLSARSDEREAPQCQQACGHV